MNLMIKYRLCEMWKCTPDEYDQIKYKNRERMIKIYKALKFDKIRKQTAAEAKITGMKRLV